MKSKLISTLWVVGAVAVVTAAAWTGFHAVADRDRGPAPSAAPVAQEGQPGQNLIAPRPEAFEELVARGSEVYAANCFSCHGGDGDGRGPWAPTLSTPARDFTDHAWMSSQSDGVLFTSVQRGVAGTPMPSFAGRLSDEDIWAVVAYLRGFSPDVRLDSPPGAAPATHPGGLGREVFEARCAGCHGITGDGNGPAAPSMGTPPRNLADQDWLAGRSDQQLSNTIRAGVPGTAMPGFGAELTAEQTDAVVDYLRTLAKGEHRPNPLSGWAQETYLAYCASCHGVQGDGAGIAAGRIEPSPRAFRNPMWMAGQTDAHLADAIKNGRPGTAMPPFGAVLSDDEITRLVEYLRAFAGPEAIPGADSAYRNESHVVDDSKNQPR